jgi:hypothetical protein
MKESPFIYFIKRYWRLIACFVLIVILGKIDAVTYFVGPVFYLVELALSAAVAAVLLRHIALRRTLDEYVNDRLQPDGTTSSAFARAWQALADSDKIKWSLIVLSVFFIGCCLIAASIAK